jgi:SNF2 family DNA or RNA helicase
MHQVQVSPKHKIVGVPYDPAVANLFPAAKEHEFDGVRHLLLPHGVTETFMLRKLGYDVPAPILTHYPWPHPIGRAPFDVQKKTCALLTLNQRAYVLNDMGTGKTACPLWAWDYLNTHGFAGKMLVVAPLSTLRAAWQREVFNVLPNRKATVLHGTKKQRLDKLNDPTNEIFIINHDGVKVILEELAKHPEIDTLTLDELAVYRSPKADRTKQVRKLAQRMKWVWGMTGGPMPRSPTDVWAQATIITPQNVPKYFKHFQDDLMYRPNPNNLFLWLPKQDAEDRAFNVLQPAVRYKLEDVTELPDAVGLDPMRLIPVEMGPEQVRIYKALTQHCQASVASGEITAANAGVAMMKLLQVATGWVYKSDGSVVALDNTKRIERLIDDIYSTNRKALVFVPFKHALAGIDKALTDEGIDHACISGDTPERERADIFTAFQTTNKYKVIAAHPQCLAHGITLTEADLTIWFAPIMSLEIYDQANRRIRRVGQKHKQLYLHYLSTPVEQKIYRMLEQHQDAQNRLLDLFEDATDKLVL